MKRVMMMHDKKTSRIRFTSSLLGIVILITGGFVLTVMAQQPEATQPQKPATRRVSTGGRDPFRKYEPPRPAMKRVANQSPIPSIQERINAYKAQKAAAMSARMPAPKPDRKSTRLNPSHSQISYAVFCLKKKKKQTITNMPRNYHQQTPSDSQTP